MPTWILNLYCYCSCEKLTVIFVPYEPERSTQCTHPPMLKQSLKDYTNWLSCNWVSPELTLQVWHYTMSSLTGQITWARWGAMKQRTWKSLLPWTKEWQCLYYIWVPIVTGIKKFLNFGVQGKTEMQLEFNLICNPLQHSCFTRLVTDLHEYWYCVSLTKNV